MTITDAHADTPRGLTFSVRDYFIFSGALNVFGFIELGQIGDSFIWLGYFLIAINLVLLLACGKLIIHRYNVYVLLVLLFTSLIAAGMSHYPKGIVFSQLAGLTAFCAYYYSIMALRDRPIKAVFDLYCRIAVWVAFFGIVKWFCITLFTGRVLRLDSIFYETPTYIFATLPAMSYTLLNWRERHWRLPMVIMLISYAMADSALGFLGIMMTLFYLTPRKSLWGLICIAVTIVGIAWGAYSFSENIQMRVNDALRTQFTEDVVASKVNRSDENAAISVNDSDASVLALMSNAYVAYQSFLSNPWLGTGIGTHRYAYDVWAPDILDKTNDNFDINKGDAASLFLRLASETGLFGLGLTGFFLVYFHRVRERQAALLRNAILPFFVIMLIRVGNYFSFPLQFFVMVYIFNYLEDRKATRQASGHAGYVPQQ